MICLQKTVSFDYAMKVIRIQWKVILMIAALIVIFANMRFYIGQAEHLSCDKFHLSNERLHHLNFYCNEPSDKVSGQEGTKSSLEGYSLLSVYAVIRHGDRHLLHQFPNYTLPSISCRISSSLIHRFPIMQQYLDVMGDQTHLSPSVPQSFRDFDLLPNRNFCEVGDLTPLGSAQHVLNGAHFRAAYIDLLSSDLRKGDTFESRVLVRSTKFPRAFQSALAFLYGFLPRLKLSELTIEVAAGNSLVYEKEAEKWSCPALSGMADIMSMTYEERVLRSSKLRDVYARLRELFGIGVDSMTPSDVFDALAIHFCHSLPPPGVPADFVGADIRRQKRCVPAEDMRSIYDVLMTNGGVFSKTGEFVRLAKLKMLPLLDEIVNRMAERAKHDNSPRFVLYSGHDTTVDPLAVALSFSEGTWPRYASRIVFELYRRRDGKLFIGVLYDGRDVTFKIPPCVPFVKTGRGRNDLCPFDAFKAYVRKGILAELKEESYESACNKKFS